MIANEAINVFDQTHELITKDDLARRSEIFKALGDKNRLKLLYLLMDGEKCVSELLPFFEIYYPAFAPRLATF